MNESNKPKMIRPSDLRREAELLIQQGKMPALEEVLQAISESRKKYAALILQARRETK